MCICVYLFVCCVLYVVIVSSGHTNLIIIFEGQLVFLISCRISAVDDRNYCAIIRAPFYDIMCFILCVHVKCYDFIMIIHVCFLCRFHAIYWPAFLMAAGLEPPRKILCHSHWLMNREKVVQNLGCKHWVEVILNNIDFFVTGLHCSIVFTVMIANIASFGWEGKGRYD